MKDNKTYRRKLSGTSFLVIRLLINFGVLVLSIMDVYKTPKEIEFMSYLYIFMTFSDAFMTIGFLCFPEITCEGNSYLKCLPFIVNAYLANLVFFYIRLPSLIDSDRPDRRIPRMAFFNIVNLILFGGLASPLNLAWTETFKPFSIVILKNRKLSMASNAGSVKNKK